MEFSLTSQNKMDDMEQISERILLLIQGRTLGGVWGGGCGGGVWGGVTPPPALENCKKSVQNSLKIVEKVGPVGRSPDVYYT